MIEALIVLAPGFEETEALCVYDVLKRGGVETLLCSLSLERTVSSSHSVKIVCDTTLSDKTIEEGCRLIFLPGGMPGAENLHKSMLLDKLIKKTNESGNLVSAICASPSYVLGQCGILSGHRATCYPGCESAFSTFDFSSEGVVVSGNVITGKSAGYAFDLGLALLGILKGDDIKEKVQKDIYYKEGVKL